MARPLQNRELYDPDIQALLRIRNAALLDDDISAEEQEKIDDGLTFAVRVLKRVTDARRPQVRERLIQEAKDAREDPTPPSPMRAVPFVRLPLLTEGEDTSGEKD